MRDEKDRYRTCCSVCHIKFGTVVLGVIESIVCVAVLLSAIQQVVWKSGGSHNCFSNILRDCLIFQFSHFNVTLVFDYIVIVMMIFILLSVCLLFFGILTDTSCLLLPHILIQGIFLLFSIGNFILYAVSYFYGDLYTHSKSFELLTCIERMWLATLLIALAMFQTYLFSAVIQCSLYITRIEENLRRRASEFERCSERVRLAKENGLWRTTSWGGGFQQYKGQFDEKKPKKSNKQRGFHVQWSAQTPEVEAVDETAGGSRPEEPTTSGQTPSERRTSSVDDATQTISTHRPKLVHQPRSLTDSSRKDRSAAPSSPRSETGSEMERVSIIMGSGGSRTVRRTSRTNSREGASASGSQRSVPDRPSLDSPARHKRDSAANTSIKTNPPIWTEERPKPVRQQTRRTSSSVSDKKEAAPIKKVSITTTMV